LDITPAASGFHAEETTDQQETIKAIANLATATAEDRMAVANLTGTNATLTKELTTTNGKLVMALTLAATLTKQNTDLHAGSSHRIPDNRTPERKHYCWTCGYRCENSSWLCPNPVTGHKTRAKAADTMNGSIKNKSNSRVEGTTSKVLKHHCNMTNSTLVASPADKAVLVSGCTSHIITKTTQCIHKIPTTNGLRAGIPNGQTMQATHNATLDLQHLPIPTNRSPGKHRSNPT
jgi:hypothetical protein